MPFSSRFKPILNIIWGISFPYVIVSRILIVVTFGTCLGNSWICWTLSFKEKGCQDPKRHWRSIKTIKVHILRDEILTYKCLELTAYGLIVVIYLRMTLLLGPPSSGKTTLLQTLAGKPNDDLRVCLFVCFHKSSMLICHLCLLMVVLDINR